MMLLQFAKLDPEADDRGIRDSLLAAAIQWQKIGVSPTAAEAALLSLDERLVLCEAYNIVHGIKPHPDAILGNAVHENALEMAGVS